MRRARKSTTQYTTQKCPCPHVSACKEMTYELEAGGIEPRNLDLQVLLRQALARMGNEGLVSCLVLLCSGQDVALVVEAWPGLSSSCKQLILDAVIEGGGE